jgi:hypothetical protein
MTTQLRWGILGTGNIARQFATGVRASRRGILAAVASRAQGSADVFAKNHQIPAALGDYQSLLARPDVDAVYVSLPNTMHHQWTLAALAAGKHVLCEKPISVTPEQAREMFDMAQRKGRVLVEAFMYRSQPLLAAVLETLASGVIGKLQIVRTSFCFHTSKIDGNIRFDPKLAAIQFLFMLANAIARLCYQEFQLRQRVDELTAVYTVTTMLADARDLQSVLQRTARVVCEVTQTMACSIRLVDLERDELVIKAVHNLSQTYLDKGPVRLSLAEVDKIALSPRGYEFVKDAGSDPRVLYPMDAKNEGIVSMLSVGMRYKGKPIGVLRVYTDKEQTFSNFRIDLVKAVAAQVARDCGVSAAPVIAPAAHDTASSVAAVPASGDSWCYISSGTWSLMGVELDEPLINDKALAYQYTNEVGVDGKIRFLKNIMGLWLIQECRRNWQRDGNDHSYAELTAMAERAESFVALINPDHGPFLAPGEIIGKIDRYCAQTGQRAPNTRGEYVRACMEGLALTYRRTLDGLENILGRRIEVIHIVGGGTQNQLLCQMTADACARTVVAGPVESTSIGNILTQALAIGQIRNLAEARAVVRESFDVKTYAPGKTSEWQKAYGRFVDLVKAS